MIGSKGAAGSITDTLSFHAPSHDTDSALMLGDFVYIPALCLERSFGLQGSSGSVMRSLSLANWARMRA